MFLKIADLHEKKLVGMRLEMSLIENKTGELFRKFMPRKKEIVTNISEGVYALQQYDFKTFSPQTIFEKWACVEVSSFENIPNEMETRLLEAGKYAVFIHKGAAKDFPKTFQYIMQEWLPKSNFIVDNRPHFEFISLNYKGPNDPNSEEEVWIPIR